MGFDHDILLSVLTLSALISAPFWAYERYVFSKKRVVIGNTPWGVQSIAPLFPALALIVALKLLFIEPFQVPSPSMRPSLSPGSIGLAFKPSYGFRLPWAEAYGFSFGAKRGDVALFENPMLAGQLYVKRVIGLPGEIVNIDRKGLITINGVQMKQTLIESCASESADSQGGELPKCKSSRQEYWENKNWSIWEAPVPQEEVQQKEQTIPEFCYPSHSGSISCKIPADSYFVLGDNRSDSYDSRHWGAVRKELLIGKVFLSFNMNALNRVKWIWL